PLFAQRQGARSLTAPDGPASAFARPEFPQRLAKRAFFRLDWTERKESYGWPSDLTSRSIGQSASKAARSARPFFEVPCMMPDTSARPPDHSRERNFRYRTRPGPFRLWIAALAEYAGAAIGGADHGAETGEEFA